MYIRLLGGWGNEGLVRVLLIDDEPLIHGLLRTVLSPLGVRLIAHHTWSEVDPEDWTAPPDLLILDCCVGQASAEMEALVRGDGETRVPLLLFSASTEDELRREAEQRGAWGWIRKGPDALETLRQRVRELQADR